MASRGIGSTKTGRTRLNDDKTYQVPTVGFTVADSNGTTDYYFYKSGTTNYYKKGIDGETKRTPSNMTPSKFKNKLTKDGLKVNFMSKSEMRKKRDVHDEENVIPF